MTQENGHVRADSPISDIHQASMRLSAASHALWDDPGQCGPGQVPEIIRETYEAMGEVISILACVQATDIDEARRAEVGDVGVTIAAAMARLRGVQARA